MKKLYTISFFLLALFSGFSSFGQQTIDAVEDNFTISDPVGFIGNLLWNDTLNGVPVTPNTVSITPITNGVLQIDNNGNIFLIGQPTSGTYAIDYTICETGSIPANCDTAIVIVIYIGTGFTPIVANPDSVTISNGIIAPQIVLENVLSNDTLDGIPITIGDVIFQQISSTGSDYFEIDESNGNVILFNSPVPAGTYQLGYFMCQATSPNNCTETIVTITVVNSLLTTITGTYNDFNADGFTNVGDVVNYTYAITNTTSSPISNVAITSTEVNIDGGPPIPVLNAGATNSTTYTGTHVITQEDINNGSVITTISTNGTLLANPISVSTTNAVNLNIEDGIKLNAFIDYNTNNVQDSGEPNFVLGEFHYELNNNGTVHNINSSTGMHTIYETNVANSYNVSYTINPAYASQYTEPPSYANITVANNSGITTYNFPVTQVPYIDLAINLLNYGAPPRPGFQYYNYIQYTNYSNQPIASGTVTFTNSSIVSLVSTSPATITTPTGFTYAFTNLLPGETRNIIVNMQVPTIPTVSLGQLVTNNVAITIPSGDINAANNTSTLSQTIIGSYDPNDKQESHGGKILHSTFTANDYLTYTIRFENTGTAEAINIRVEDVLDSQLDASSVRMVSASNQYVLDRVGSNLTWHFDGVNLPPSSPASTTIGHGYIVFQVKPNAGYAIGDIIPNYADIYFDFNPAIVTNICNTEFVATLVNTNFAFSNLNYYPNPVKNSFTVSNKSVIDAIEITSVLGQQMLSQKVNNLQTEVDLSSLSNGIYFVKISSEGNEKTVKIVKE